METVEALNGGKVQVISIVYWLTLQLSNTFLEINHLDLIFNRQLFKYTICHQVVSSVMNNVVIYIHSVLSYIACNIFCEYNV